MDDADRPQTSARDYAELHERLTAWVRDRVPTGAEPAIEDLTVPERNGMSSETILFDLVTSGPAGQERRSCVARIEPESNAVPVFPRYDLDKQFKVMQLVAELTDVPVPAVLWLEMDPGAVGSPFFVMERIEGEVPPDVMPYTFGSWLSEASRADQQRLQRSTVRVLADLHGIPDAVERFAFLTDDAASIAAGGSALRHHVDATRRYYDWVIGGTPVPVLERGFAWLEEHWPSEEGPTVLSWGDSRVGNTLYRDFEPVGVLDWEMASLAPPEVDLGWLVFLHCFFDDIARTFELDGMPHFLRPQDVGDTYEELSGYAPRDRDFYLTYAALRHGVVMSRVEQRRIHFGEVEQPDDPDDTVMHRAALEALYDGTYWEGRP